MKRAVAFLAVLTLVLAVAAPVGARRAETGRVNFALEGEARALEIGIGEQGATLGYSFAWGESAPRAIGVAAGQCTLVEDDPNPDDLPCNESTTSRSEAPGNGGTAAPSCAQNIDQLRPTLGVQLACGASTSKILRQLPSTKNRARVTGVDAVAPVGELLAAAPSHDALVDDLSDALDGVLGEPVKKVKDAADDLVSMLEDIVATDALDIQVGPSSSDIVPRGKKLTVKADAAGARIGVLSIPEGVTSSAPVDLGPLEDGLVIIDVGRSTAQATIDTRVARATSKASPALVTVKVRDITQDEPEYHTITVAPGETVTVLEGTPAESTITAADATSEESGNTARAAADAVRLHLLKGVSGGITIGLGRTTAAVNVAKVLAAGPQPPKNVLPVTGGNDYIVPGIGLLVGALALVLLRRRFSAR